MASYNRLSIPVSSQEQTAFFHSCVFETFLPTFLADSAILAKFWSNLRNLYFGVFSERCCILGAVTLLMKLQKCFRFIEHCDIFDPLNISLEKATA